MPLVIDLTTLSPTEGFIVQGDAAGDQAGTSVSSAGDINGDGIDDFIVGATRGGGSTGMAYVIFGRVGATRANIDLTNLTASDGFIVQGDALGDRLGIAVSSAGDVNGDGIDDLIVGAHNGDDGGLDAGEAYVIFGKAGATRTNIDLSSLAASDGFIIQGDAAGDIAGWSLSSAGDINDDGIDDLIVGAPRSDIGGLNSGEAYVIFGKVGATRANIDLTSLAANDGFIMQGNSAGDNAGFSVSSAGDINGDGIDDLIVSAPYGDNGGANAGEAYVIFGKAGATRANIDLTSLSANEGFIIQGDSAYDTAGISVSNAGDINGDGFADVVVGAPLGDNGGDNAGEAYVIYGRAALTSPAGTRNGTAVADILNGTTFADQLFGLNGNDTLWGGGGNDMLDGGEGDDLLDGGTGSDILIGGNGSDILRVSASVSPTSISGFEALQLVGGANLTLTGSQFANGLAKTTAVSGTGSITVNMDAGINFLSQSFAFAGNAVTVTVNGTSGTDIIKSGAAVHTINGGGGNDQIRGGVAVDTINGGADNDKIIGFSGADIITGGAGNDQFRYLFATDSGLGVNADQITDFVIGSDRLNFALLDTNPGLAGVQGFAFVGNAAFSGGGAAQLRYTNSGADLLVQADVDGDGIADMEIILQGQAGGTLTAGDFIL